jgi:hypothetical protein
MGDFTGNVMRYMGLGDTMGASRPNPCHEATKVTQKVTVQGAKSTSDECKLGGAIVRQERIGVLKEGDENQPMVHPET